MDAPWAKRAGYTHSFHRYPWCLMGLSECSCCRRFTLHIPPSLLQNLEVTSASLSPADTRQVSAQECLRSGNTDCSRLSRHPQLGCSWATFLLQLCSQSMQSFCPAKNKELALTQVCKINPPQILSPWEWHPFASWGFHPQSQPFTPRYSHLIFCFGWWTLKYVKATGEAYLLIFWQFLLHSEMFPSMFNLIWLLPVLQRHPSSPALVLVQVSSLCGWLRLRKLW